MSDEETIQEIMERLEDGEYPQDLRDEYNRHLLVRAMNRLANKHSGVSDLPTEAGGEE